MKKLFFVSVFLFFSVSSYAQFLFGTFSPIEDWKKVETKYFEIYFTPKSENFASRVYSVCDEVYELVKVKMNSGFSYKFPIVVVDSSDLPNGFYLPVPFPRIVLYSSIINKDSYFISDDDIKILFLHELVHALAIEPARGFWSVLRDIFGYYIIPNAYVPGVFMESVTVLNESAWGFGRINNPMFTDMLLADVYYNKFKSFYKASLVGYDFSGHEWYLYGGLFFDYLREKYGYDKVLSFYTENSYYMPNFFYLAFKNTFGKTIFEEWDQFRSYAYVKLSNRISDSQFPEFLTSEGWYKNDFRFFGNFVIYSQGTTKGSLSGLKYVSTDKKKKGFLLYDRYIDSFDIKGNTIAFIEYIVTRYEARCFLKFAKLGFDGYKPYVYDEVDTGVSGVYKVSLRDDKTAFLLVDRDGKTYICSYSLGGKVSNVFDLGDRVGIDIDISENYLVLLSRLRGEGIIEVFDVNTWEKIHESTNVGLAFSARFSKGSTSRVTISSIEGERVNVFSYDLSSGKLERIVKPIFAVGNPVEIDGEVYGISLSKDGYEIVKFETKKEEVNFVDRHVKVYFPELLDITSVSFKLTNVSEYSFFNRITPLYILSTFFPVVEFNYDFSLRRLGVLFGFCDEPLEFRYYYIDFSWDFNANAIDYTFTFMDSSIPYVRTSFNLFRYHVVDSDFLGSRLKEIGYNYKVFTFDYVSLGASGEVFNNYLYFYPFVYFSLPSFVGKDSDSIFPGYYFENSSKVFFSPYLTMGAVFSTFKASIGALAPEEGIYFSTGVRMANEVFGSRTNVYVFSSFLGLAFRVFGNNVLKFDFNFRTSDFSDAFGFVGFRYPEFFPVSEGRFDELSLYTYLGGRFRNYLTSSLSAFVKFFELNEGVWPVYITSFWGSVGLVGGLLFNDFSLDLVPKFEAKAGIFFNVDIPGNGFYESKNGVEIYYNFENGNVYFKYWLFFIVF